MNKQPFNFKALTSFLLTAAFFVSVLSGIMLYISPPGRLANWTNWQILGFSKTQWTAFHIVFIALFIIAGVFHIFYFNWKPLCGYIKRKSRQGIYYQREFWIAVVISLVLAVGTWAKIPPMVSIVDLGDYITYSWETKEEQPPESHAELFTLQEFADKIQLPIESVMNTLREQGYAPEGGEQSLENLAEHQGVAPVDIYNLFSEAAEEAGMVKTGGGYGRMKLDKLAEELGMTMEEARTKLAAAGIEGAKDNQTLREIGDAHDMTPVDVFNALSPEKAEEH